MIGRIASCWSRAAALGKLAQGELQTSIDQLTPFEFVASVRQSNATLEAAVGQLEASDDGRLRRQRQVALGNQDQQAVFEPRLDPLRVDTRQGDLDEQRVVSVSTMSTGGSQQGCAAAPASSKKR